MPPAEEWRRPARQRSRKRASRGMRHARGALALRRRAPGFAIARRFARQHRRRRLRLADQVALRITHAQLAQALQLLLRLHAFDDHVRADAVRHRHDRTDHRHRARALEHVPRERLVDLDELEVELVQVGEVGIAGAEVVERERHAVRAAVLHHRRDRRVVEHAAFGDFQLERARRQLRALRRARRSAAPCPVPPAACADRFTAMLGSGVDAGVAQAASAPRSRGRARTRRPARSARFPRRA